MAKKASTPRAGDAARLKIPSPIRHQVLMEAGYKCGRPVCHNVIALDLHHLIYVSDGGNNDASNLLPLCGYCHDMHHRGEFPTEAIRLWKGLLVALNHAFDRKSMDLLIYLTKQPEFARYSADGALQFAGLIASGLAQFGSGFVSNHIGGGAATSFHQIQLTEKGRLLVEAWLAGDESKYREALTALNK
jgi:hypothetical protein